MDEQFPSIFDGFDLFALTRTAPSFLNLILLHSSR